MKISLEEQISTVERARDYAFDNRRDAQMLSWTERYALDAAIATLRSLLPPKVTSSGTLDFDQISDPNHTQERK